MSALPAGPARLDRWALMVFVGTQTLAIGVIVGLLSDIQDRSGFPTWTLGVITGISFLAALVGHLTLSPFADRGNERVMILLGGVLTVGSLIWMVFATAVWHWVVARGLLGLAEGAFVPAARRIAIRWAPEDPGKALSTLFTAVLVGFVIGPPIGAFLNESVGPDAPFIVPAVVASAALLLLVRIRIEGTGAEHVRVHRRALVANPALAAGVMLGASQWLVIGVLDSIWARYVADLGGSVPVIGVSFLALVVPTIVFNPISGRAADRLNPIRVGVVALVIEAPLIGAFGLSGGLTVLVALAAIQAVAFAFVTVPAQAAVARVSPPGQVAEAQGIIEAVGLVAAGLGAISAPALYQAFGPGPLFGVTMVVLLVVASAVWLNRRKWRLVLDRTPGSDAAPGPAVTLGSD